MVDKPLQPAYTSKNSFAADSGNESLVGKNLLRCTADGKPGVQEGAQRAQDARRW